MVDLLDEAGVGARLHLEGTVHHSIELVFKGQRHAIDVIKRFEELAEKISQKKNW